MKNSKFFWAWNGAQLVHDNVMTRGRAARMLAAWRAQARAGRLMLERSPRGSGWRVTIRDGQYADMVIVKAV